MLQPYVGRNCRLCVCPARDGAQIGSYAKWATDQRFDTSGCTGLGSGRRGFRSPRATASTLHDGAGAEGWRSSLPGMLTQTIHINWAFVAIELLRN